MVSRLGAVFLFTPVFVIPAIAIAVFGIWIGQVYIKAQLSVKREMSNAKAPVLGIFGAAISGLRGFSNRRIGKSNELTGLDSLYSRIWRTGGLQEGD